MAAPERGAPILSRNFRSLREKTTGDERVLESLSELLVVNPSLLHLNQVFHYSTDCSCVPVNTHTAFVAANKQDILCVSVFICATRGLSDWCVCLYSFITTQCAAECVLFGT